MMPLPHLFKKRNSDSRPRPQGESKMIPEDIHSVSAEANEVLKTLLDAVADKEDDSQIIQETDALKASETSDLEGGGKCSDSGIDEDKNCATSDNVSSKSSTRRIRSTSERVTEKRPDGKHTNRRKCGSESEIIPLLLKSVPLKRNEVDAVIGKYVNKLIRDSICNAIKNVNVDGLYEQILSDVVKRKSSDSTESLEDFVMEQRLTSDSISELVEFEAAYDDDKSDDVDSSSMLPSRIGEEVNDDTQPISAGYLADLEDTVSLDDSRSVGKDSLDASSNDIDVSQRQCCDVAVEHEVIQNHVSEKDTPSPSLKIDAVEININNENSDISQPTGSCMPPSSAQENLQSDKNKILGDTEIATNSNCKDAPKMADVPSTSSEGESQGISSPNESVDLILISPENESSSITIRDSKDRGIGALPPDLGENLPQQPQEDEKKVSWKVGYLHVKLPHKARGKTQLKAWKKRRVAIQPDEFVNDPNNPSLVISIYGADKKRHTALFWQAVSGKKGVVYRSSSRSHRYAFTVAEDGRPVVHLSAENETTTQEWMAGIRAVLWPPSSFLQLEKMLSGREFEISLIDNDFSYHAGLLGMYGYLTITPKKLILLHPQEGYVIQEWYLNTVDNFQLVTQQRTEDAHKVLAMTTCSDSSTGRGEILLFCNEAVTLLQSLALTIHQVLSYHSKQEGGRYQKELEELAEWLVMPPQDALSDEHYKVPTRQVKSLLDIPNFIFEKSLSPVASAVYPAPRSGEVMEPLATAKGKPTAASHDSGISTGTCPDEMLNCSVTSFVVGGGPMTGKSSDSELSDTYTPPRSPVPTKKTVESGEKPKDKRAAMDKA